MSGAAWAVPWIGADLSLDRAVAYLTEHDSFGLHCNHRDEERLPRAERPWRSIQGVL